MTEKGDESDGESGGLNRGREGKTLNISVHQCEDVWAVVVSLVTKRKANTPRDRVFICFLGHELGIWLNKHHFEHFTKKHALVFVQSLSMCVCFCMRLYLKTCIRSPPCDCVGFMCTRM